MSFSSFEISKLGLAACIFVPLLIKRGKEKAEVLFLYFNNNEVISNLPLFTSECKFQTPSKLVKIKLSKIVPVLFKTPTTLYGCSAWTSPVSIKPCEPTKNLFIFKFVTLETL